MGQNKFRVLVEGAAFRVCTIITLKSITNKNDLVFVNNPMYCGLSIEKAIYDCGLSIEKAIYDDKKEKHYITIALVYWDEEEREVFIEDCQLRTIYELQDLPKEELDEYFNCMEFAINVLSDIHKGENNEN